MTWPTRRTNLVDDHTAEDYNLLIDQLQALTGPAGWIQNCRLSVAAPSNILTVTLKTLAGTDPTALDPIAVRIGNTIRLITAALSITIAAGTNWFNSGSAELGTKLVGYFPYLVWDSNSSVVALTIARFPSARLVSNFSATTTNEKHGYSYANFTTTDEVVNIGYFEATLSLAGTSHLWTVPTFTNLNLRNQPTFESQQLTWTPQHSRTGGAYSNLPAQSTAIYTVHSRGYDFREVHTQNATPGSSGFQQFTLPFTATGPSTLLARNASTAAELFGTISTGSNICSLALYDGTAQVTANNIYVTTGVNVEL